MKTALALHHCTFTNDDMIALTQACCAMENAGSIASAFDPIAYAKGG
ncbi:MAG: hypothetical protein QM681_04765 [Novosphingobium sp.]